MNKRKNNFPILYHIHTVALYCIWPYGPWKNRTQTQRKRESQRKEEMINAIYKKCSKCKRAPFGSLFSRNKIVASLAFASLHRWFWAGVTLHKKVRTDMVETHCCVRRTLYTVIFTVILQIYILLLYTLHRHRHSTSIHKYDIIRTKSKWFCRDGEYSVNHRIYFVHFYAISLYMWFINAIKRPENIIL